MVFDSSVGKGMTLKQYTTHMKEQSVSKSEVVRLGIMTKSQLEAALLNQHLTVITIGTGQYLTKASIQKYLGGS